MTGFARQISSLAMQPPDDNSGKEPKKLNRKLPPELEFLHELGNRPQMEREELGQWARGFLKKVEENRELMRAHGIDADRLINTLQKPIEEVEKAHREAEEAQDQFLHATADVADSTRTRTAWKHSSNTPASSSSLIHRCRSGRRWCRN